MFEKEELDEKYSYQIDEQGMVHLFRGEENCQQYLTNPLLSTIFKIEALKKENVLCYCKVVSVKFCCVGHTIIGGDNKIRWWSGDRSEKLNVYAWKEIVPPKEIKENEN